MSKPTRPHSQIPDLFSFVTQSDSAALPPSSARVPTVEEPFVLPEDLPAALKQLPAESLDVLAAALAHEMTRRRRLADAVSSSDEPSLPSRGRRPLGTVEQGRGKPSAKGAALTQAKINGIRAAFKAGVKLPIIARQFGLSLAAIRQVLQDRTD